MVSQVCFFGSRRAEFRAGYFFGGHKKVAAEVSRGFPAKSGAQATSGDCGVRVGNLGRRVHFESLDLWKLELQAFTLDSVHQMIQGVGM